LKKILLFIPGFFFFTFHSLAQFSVLGADAFGRANSLVAVPGFSSIYQNPGGLGGITAGFLAFHYLKILPVEGFHTTGVQGVFTGKWLNYGFCADSFGDRHYRESRAGLALAGNRDHVSVGLKVSYAGAHPAGAGTRKTLTGDAGMVVTPVPALTLGLCLFNFTSAGFYNREPVTLAVGAALRADQKVQFSAQMDYRTGHRAVMRFGLHYQVREQLGFSAGIDPEMRRVHFGARVLAGRYGFYYSIATHPYAGIAHHTTFIYTLHE